MTRQVDSAILRRSFSRSF
ncbi:hypothetical protein MTR67_043097 [Solanum verrucosum]|uniref:Uncharacterized protein n=1 Tax=Solanum verrucosum TaxID=315347 RepID=A0AAF0ZRS3_SOLVR|nr:hypothetical protein MTR67_043097 [Solanum verrucosum]